MKKLIRLFLILFCIFFALSAMPGSFVPALRRAVRQSGRLAGEATLRIAEIIDDISPLAPDRQAGGQDLPASEQEPGNSDGKGTDPAPGVSGQREENAKEPDADSQKTEKGEKGEKPDTDSQMAENAKEPGADAQMAENTKEPGADAQMAEKETEPDTDKEAAEDSAGSGNGKNDSRRAGSEKNRPAGDNIFYYYYTKISREERLLYDAMLTLAENPALEDDAEESRLLSTDPSSDAFAQSYTRAYNALVSDHPELFWVAQGRVKYACRYYVLPAFGGKYKVFLSLTDSSAPGSGSGSSADSADSTDPAAGFRAKYHKEQEELQAAADALLDRVDFTRSDAEIALQLHDLLIDSAWYNLEAGPDDYAHTAYGALVQDSSGSPGGALCDGYALAYEYLLQRAGLTSTMVCGYAGASEEDNEKHAWNLVLLDNDWYEVDATWDDLDFLLSPSDDGYELLLEALSDEDYMARIRHYMFNRTTDEMRSFTPGDEFTYTSYKGWVTLLQPSVHIRFTSEESEQTRDYVTPLAPQAQGTWYTWEMLTGHD